MSSVGPEVLARLLDQVGPALELFARQWCQSPGDVVQEAFVRLLAQPAEPQNVVGWLYRTVRNAAIDAARSQQRRQRHEAAAGEQVARWFEPDESVAIDAEAAAAHLSQLPIELRETIVLRLWSGMSFEEIAELTGASSSTAHRRYQSGLESLRQSLGFVCRKNKNTDPS